MLKDNCKKSKEIMLRLQNMNRNRCDPNNKGNTQRDTINNKRLCYDDIHKEIVSKLDAESNCVMSQRIKSVSPSSPVQYKTLGSISSVPRNQKSFSSQNIKPDEGPEFINQYFIPTYDSKKASAYSSYNLNSPVAVSHKYPASAPYDDVSRLSDQGFLYQLAGYEQTKPLSGFEYKSNIKN